jgi:uncharacterized iron-regulated membrane protein
LRPIHTWVGLTAGALLSIIGLAGSVIVFRREFERAAMPGGSAALNLRRTVSLDDAVKEIVRVMPDARIRRVRLPASAGDPYLFQMELTAKATEQIVLDSATGRVLGTARAGWVDWMIDLHRNLLSGKQGRKAVGFAGIVLLTLSMSGILMWLTGRRNWRAWTLVRREGPSRRFHFELHRATGLWTFTFLALISFTGIERSFPDTFRAGIVSLTGEPATVKAPRGGKARSTRPLEEYLQTARTAMPDGVPVELRLPDSGKGVVDIRLHRPGDLAPDGNHVYLEPGSAAVMMIDRLSDRPAGARFLAALAPIHYGEFGGIPIKALWSLLGLTPSVLFITGFVAWRRPAQRKSDKLARAPREAEVVLAGQ